MLEGAGRSWIGQVGFAGAIGGLAGAALGRSPGRQAGDAWRGGGGGRVGGFRGGGSGVLIPGEIPALWQRIARPSALMAPLGWAAGRFANAGPVVVGTSAGTVVGAFGLRPQKVALGPVVGASVGLAAARRRGVPTAAVASAYGAGVPAAVGAAVP